MDASIKRNLVLLITLLPVVLLSTSSPVLGQIRAEAIPGEPFGVGRVEVVLPGQMQPEVLGLTGLGLTEANGRVLYPAVDAGLLSSAVLDEVKGVLDRSRRPVGRLLSELSELLKPPPQATIYFLFLGDAPLELSLQSRRTDTFVVTPAHDPAAYPLLFEAWWRQYTASAGLLTELLGQPVYPPQVEN